MYEPIYEKNLCNSSRYLQCIAKTILHQQPQHQLAAATHPQQHPKWNNLRQHHITPDQFEESY
jgi:hypothetical protein